MPWGMAEGGDCIFMTSQTSRQHLLKVCVHFHGLRVLHLDLLYDKKNNGNLTFCTPGPFFPDSDTNTYYKSNDRQKSDTHTFVHLTLVPKNTPEDEYHSFERDAYYSQSPLSSEKHNHSFIFFEIQSSRPPSIPVSGVIENNLSHSV